MSFNNPPGISVHFDIRRRSPESPKEDPYSPRSSNTSHQMRPSGEQDTKGLNLDVGAASMAIEDYLPGDMEANIPGVSIPAVVITSEADPVGLNVANADSFQQPRSKEFLSLPGSDTQLVIDHGEIPDLSDAVKKIPNQLGREGSHSTVYGGEYQGQMVAIKILRSVSLEDNIVKRKSARELVLWWTLVHPNIVPLFGIVLGKEYGEFGGLVSPWCIYGNATIYLEKNPDLLSLDKIYLWIDVAYGLTFLHTYDLKDPIIHGDLKPANILVDDSRIAKICDFGLLSFVRSLGLGGTESPKKSDTIRYLPRELVDNESDQCPTTTSDIYALGCIGMEFLYGIRPYAHETEYGTIGEEIERGVPPAKCPLGTEKFPELTNLWQWLENCWTLEGKNRPDAASVSRYLVRRSRHIDAAFSEWTSLYGDGLHASADAK